eukprot:scaffold32700_cov48-Phaeocystis_antarctica.AAC.1
MVGVSVPPVIAASAAPRSSAPSASRACALNSPCATSPGPSPGAPETLRGLVSRLLSLLELRRDARDGPACAACAACAA